MFNTTGSLLQAVRSGQVHGLAQSTPKRSPLAPELPTFAEAGVPGFDVSSWYGLFAPAKTPPEIVKKMHDDTAKLLDEPDTRKKYENLGIEAAGATADEMTAMMNHEVALWGPVIKAANIRGE
jgi:tripartite-type tricarboxylate transporter receptor subunit TctC